MKKKRTNKVQPLDISASIHRSLRADFSCTEEDIDFINHALKKMLPEEDSDYLMQVHDGKIKPPPQPKFALDMGNGEIEKFSFTGHPVTVALQYLAGKYGWRLGSLFWHALISSTPQDFCRNLNTLKKTPFFQEIIEKDQKTGRSEDEL